MEAKKIEEEKTSITPNASGDEENNNPTEGDTSQKNVSEDEEQVTISKKELETLRKKGEDFEGIIKKKKSNQFVENVTGQKPEVDVDEIVEKAKQSVLDEINSKEKEKQSQEFVKNLGIAADEIISKYDFLDDKALKVMNETFEPGNSVSKEDLLVALDRNVKINFPDQYESFLKKKLQREILAEDGNVNLGGIGANSSVHKDDTSHVLTEDEKTVEKYKKNLPPGYHA